MSLIIFFKIQFMAQDIFDKIKKNRGPIGQHSKGVHGYFTFPKLEGEIGNKMIFRGKEVLIWSVLTIIWA